MAKAKRKAAPGDVATNRQASFRYHLLDRLEAGIVLRGTEVKSLRTNGAQMRDSYATLTPDGELWLHNLHIPPYAPAARENHDPDRSRKLLLHRREIDRLTGMTAEKGLALVPVRVYFAHGLAKVEIGVGRGKRAYEKRQATLEREHRREMERAVSRRR